MWRSQPLTRTTSFSQVDRPSLNTSPYGSRMALQQPQSLPNLNALLPQQIEDNENSGLFSAASSPSRYSTRPLDCDNLWGAMETTRVDLEAAFDPELPAPSQYTNPPPVSRSFLGLQLARRLSLERRRDQENLQKTYEKVLQATAPLSLRAKPYLSKLGTGAHILLTAGQHLPVIDKAAKALLTVWECVQGVKKNKQQFLKLAEKCASWLLRLKEHIEDADEDYLKIISTLFEELIRVMESISEAAEKHSQSSFPKRLFRYNLAAAELDEFEKKLEYELKAFQIGLGMTTSKGVYGLSREIKEIKHITDQKHTLVAPAGKPNLRVITTSAQSQEEGIELPQSRYPEFGNLPYLPGLCAFDMDVTSMDAFVQAVNNQIPMHVLPMSASTSRSHLLADPSTSYPAPTPPDITESGSLPKLTRTALIIKALGKAMMEVPEFRTSINPLQSSPTIAPPKHARTIRPDADITLVLPTPTGTYHPTLLSVSSLSLYTLTSRICHISSLGQQMPSPPPQFFEIFPSKGGTTTLFDAADIGCFEYPKPFLVEGGGVAIFALGKARWVPADDGEGRRLITKVTWSADHRYIGISAMRALLACLKRHLDSPARLLAEDA